MSRQESINPRQFSLPIDGGPRTLIGLDIPGVERLVLRLQQDKLWPKIGSGLLLNLHANEPERISFDVKQCAILSEKEMSGKYAVSVLLMPSLDVQSPRIEHVVGAVTDLATNGVFYAIEERGPDIDAGWRLTFLGDTGLVERTILTSEQAYLVWRGRLPREHTHHAIDLIEIWRNSDEPWKRTRLHDIAVEVKRRYEQCGLTVVNWDLITENLHATRNPIASIHSLERGGGVRLQSLCGCEWQTDLTGDMHNVYVGCPDHTEKSVWEHPFSGNSGIPTNHGTGSGLKESSRVYVIDRPVETSRECDECGAFLQVDTRVVRYLGGGRVIISQDFSCPHDGLVTTNQLTVRRDQLSK